MKKFIALTLILCLAFTMSVTTFAYSTATVITQDTPATQAGDTEVRFTVNPTYTVIIPAVISLSPTPGAATVTYTNSGEISAEDVRLLNGQEITVTLESASDFEMETEEGATLEYEVRIGSADDAISSGVTVATFTTQADEQSVTLNYSAEDPEFAGTYTDTLTFTIAVENSDI